MSTLKILNHPLLGGKSLKDQRMIKPQRAIDQHTSSMKKFLLYKSENVLIIVLCFEGQEQFDRGAREVDGADTVRKGHERHPAFGSSALATH